MKTFIITAVSLFFSFNILSCDYFTVNKDADVHSLMGKKSKFYDAYKQGRCVLEDALKPLTDEQRKIIANLIAKSYTTVK